MRPVAQIDPFERFAEIERLISKVYFRFSHLFLYDPELRDFWWEMARDEERQASVLLACCEFIRNSDERWDPKFGQENADRLEALIRTYLGQGTPSITADEAFQMALEIESSEIDTIYKKLLHLGGRKSAQIMENFGMSADAKKKRLKSAFQRFVRDPRLLKAAERL